VLLRLLYGACETIAHKLGFSIQTPESQECHDSHVGYEPSRGVYGVERVVRAFADGSYDRQTHSLEEVLR
jgi:hypothetical protein